MPTITFTLNHKPVTTHVAAHERLLRTLRRLGCYSVKFGDEHGLTGADTVLLDGAPVNAQSMLAAQADGHTVLTLEGIGTSKNLHPLQQAFIETGAIQSGYCTPAQILVAYALLKQNPNPTEAEVREALNGRARSRIRLCQAGAGDDAGRGDPARRRGAAIRTAGTRHPGPARPVRFRH